jgi:hypothetical protein
MILAALRALPWPSRAPQRFGLVLICDLRSASPRQATMLDKLPTYQRDHLRSSTASTMTTRRT